MMDEERKKNANTPCDRSGIVYQIKITPWGRLNIKYVGLNFPGHMASHLNCIDPIKGISYRKRYYVDKARETWSM